MQIKITNLTNGSYDVLGNLLYFKDEKSDVTINKKAALEYYAATILYILVNIDIHFYFLFDIDLVLFP